MYKYSKLLLCLIVPLASCTSNSTKKKSDIEILHSLLPTIIDSIYVADKWESTPLPIVFTTETDTLANRNKDLRKDPQIKKEFIKELLSDAYRIEIIISNTLAPLEEYDVEHFSEICGGKSFVYQSADLMNSYPLDIMEVETRKNIILIPSSIITFMESKNDRANVDFHMPPNPFLKHLGVFRFSRMIMNIDETKGMIIVHKNSGFVSRGYYVYFKNINSAWNVEKVVLAYVS